MSEYITEDFKDEFRPLIEEGYAGLPAVEKPSMKQAIYQVIANTKKELSEATTSTADVAQYTPVLISLIRRVLPTLVGPQFVGMQPMQLPTGRIFVQHVFAGANETWGNGTVGTSNAAGSAPNASFGGPYTNENGEKLGSFTKNDSTSALEDTNPYPEMSFSISSIDVSAKTRALKGKLTTEVISDLKSVHGMDAEQEIANILQAEIVAEIDREIVSRIYTEAKAGAVNTVTPGTFDFSVDADGRWSMEKVMGLLIQIEREATWIAQETRRGRGNFIITSPELAAYLSMANLITNEYKNAGFTSPVNPVGVSYYGLLCNRFKVYVDPYLTATTTDGKQHHKMVVGYKGASEYDSGLFYCPYIPIAFYKATSDRDFGMNLGIKSRYGIISNPYYCAASSTAATNATNSFFRQFKVVVD